jgi:hypothetical protein
MHKESHAAKSESVQDAKEQLRKELQKHLGQLYFAETNDLDETLDMINQNVGSMGACLRPLEYGDVAWRCLEC